MANEIWHNYDEGNTLYAVIHRRTDDKVYDVAAGSDTFETWADANIDNYDLALTDHDGDYYSVDFPSGISSGVYRITIFLQVGASPHVDNDISIAQGELYWDGTAEVNLLTLDTDVDSVLSAQVSTLNVYGEGE